ncbi:MAG: hypothetical protein Q9173_004344 [Seirophora scorigena]
MEGSDINGQRGFHGLMQKDHHAQLAKKFSMLESATSDEFADKLHRCRNANGPFACTSPWMYVASGPKIVAATRRFTVDNYTSG